MAARGQDTTEANEISLKEKFFRFFQHEITAIQEQMARLADTALVGGERSDATDHCLAGIARLSSEVRDASSYLPTYDQRTYAEAIKALQEKFNETRATFASRTRFTFKTARKNPSAISLNDAAELAAQKRLHLSGYRSPDTSSIESSLSTTPNHLRTPPNDDLSTAPTQPLLPAPLPTSAGPQSGSSNSLDPQTAAARRPFYSTSASVSISHQTSAHIILPSSATHASAPCSLTQLTKCVVDLSVPSTDGAPFAGLTVKSVRQCLLVCGNVEGAAHVTDVQDSVIVVTSRQFRMHECSNVDVYLSCSSRPIIEDCKAIHFARIPDTYHHQIPKGAERHDLWDQVDDFKWLKPEHSPNWDLLGPEDTVLDDTWREIVPGGPGWTLDDILKATKVIK